MAQVGTVTVPVNVDPVVTIETLSLNDGDVLVLSVPGQITRDVADRINREVGRVVRATGKRVAMVILPEGHALDRLTAKQVRDLYRRVAGGEESAEGEGRVGSLYGQAPR